MFRKSKTEKDLHLPKLLTSLTEASEIISAQIGKGEKFCDFEIKEINQLHSLESKFKSWNNENIEILKKIFDIKTIATEYATTTWSFGSILISNLTFEEKAQKLKNKISHKTNKLRSIYSTLELFNKDADAKQIYFVHSKDTVASKQVMDFLKAEGFYLVIIKQLSDAGSTIIDNIEANPNIKHAVIMLSPDENNGNHPDLNVLLELGIFVGSLGRENVSALYEEHTILPTDYHGFKYINFAEKWEKTLQDELRSSINNEENK